MKKQHENTSESNLAASSSRAIFRHNSPQAGFISLKPDALASFFLIVTLSSIVLTFASMNYFNEKGISMSLAPDSAKNSTRPLTTLSSDLGQFENLTIGEDVKIAGDLFIKGEKLIIPTFTAGNAISIDGTSDITISNNGVASLQSQTGDLKLTAGNGITIDGLTITNNAPNAIQSTFEFIKVTNNETDTTFGASKSNDTLTFVAGGNINIASDTTNKKLTISGTATGWQLSGSNVHLSDSTYNVGIGTTTPTGRLHLSGDVNAGDSTSSVGLTIGNQTQDQGVVRLLYTNAAASGSPMATLSFQPRDNADASNIDLANIDLYKTTGADTGYITFRTRNATSKTERMRIDPDGNVGIGTSTPTHRLSVGADTAAASSGSIAIKQTGSFDGFLSQASSNDDFLRLYHTGSAATLESTYQSTGGYTPISFRTSATEVGSFSAAGQFAVPVTGSSAGISIGGDTQLYRGAADRLDLTGNDGFYVHGGSGGGLGIGITPSASKSLYIDRIEGNSTRSTEFMGLDSSISSIQFTASITNERLNYFGGLTVTGDTGTRTITNYATLYVADGATVGANAAVTNNYALWVDAGKTRLDGRTIIGTGGNDPSAAQVLLSYGEDIDSGLSGTTRYGLLTRPVFPSSLTNTAVGISSAIQTSAASYTLSTGMSFRAANASIGAGSTLTNQYGLYIDNQTSGGNDYGVYIEGADTYALWVDAGTSRFDGNVGIGASPATSTLIVTGSPADHLAQFNMSGSTNGSAAVYAISNGGGSTGPYYGVYGNASTAGANYGGYFAITSASGKTGYALYADAGSGAGTEYAAALMNGNVGIGTATPATRLHLTGSTTTGANLQIEFEDSASNDLLMGITAANSFDFVTSGGTTNLTIALATGQIAIPTTGSGAGLLIGGDAQLYRSAADTLALASGDSLNIVNGNILLPTNGSKVGADTSMNYLSFGYTSGEFDINASGQRARINLDTDNDSTTTAFQIYTDAANGTGSLLFHFDEAGYFSVSTNGTAGGIWPGTDVQIYRSAANTLALASGDSLSLVSGNLSFAAASDIIAPSNTSGALDITDGSTSYYTLDTRTTISGVMANLFNSPARTVPDGATSTTVLFRTQSGNITYTGPTQITELQELNVFAGNTLLATNALTIDKATTLRVVAPVESTNLTLTDASAIRVINSSGTPANQYGLYIEDMTTGTADYGIAIAGADTAALWISSAADTTDAANGITFGLSRDTNLYRGATNNLYTDDSLQVRGGTLNLGIADTTGGTLNIHGASSGDTGAYVRFYMSADHDTTDENWVNWVYQDDMYWSLATTGSMMRLDNTGRLNVTTTGSSAGVAIGGDTLLYRSAADTLALASGDALYVVNGGGGAVGIGAAPNAGYGVYISNDFSYGSGEVHGLKVGEMTLTQTSAAGSSVQTASFGINSSVVINSGVAHNLVSNAYFSMPSITETSGSVTNAANVYIEGAPTAATNNYALWVDSGAVQFDAALTVGTSITATTGDITATAGKFTTSASGQSVGLQLDGYVDASSFNNYVLNNSAAAGTYATLNFGRTTGLLFGFIRSNNNTQAIELGTAATTRLSIDTNGQVALSTTGSTGGLLIGGDANLYRSAADTLKTDDSFVAGSITLSATTISVPDGNTLVLSGGASGQVEVQQNLKLDANGTATTNGICHSGVNSDTTFTDRDVVACSGAPADTAEFYETESNVEEGDLVMTTSQTFSYESQATNAFTGELEGTVNRSISVLAKATQENSSTLIGVVSSDPYQAFGRDIIASGATNPQPIALSGRVPVKVSAENGPIQTGDAITSSSIPGVGMRATKAGRIVGTALQSYSGEGIGSVIVFVNPSYFLGTAIAQTVSDDPLFSLLDSVGDLNTQYQGQILSSNQVQKLIGEQAAVLGIATDGVSTVSAQLVSLSEDFSLLEENLNSQQAAIASIAATLANLPVINLTQFATGSAVLGITIVEEDFAVTGNTTLSNLSTIGNITVANNLTLGATAINTIGEDLQIQPLKQGNVSFMDGLVTIDTTGNVVVSGKITAPTLETGKLIITTDATSQTIGSATIPAGQTELVIETTAVTPESKILLSPTAQLNGKSLYVSNKTADISFTVSLDGETTQSDITFDWFILEAKSN